MDKGESEPKDEVLQVTGLKVNGQRGLETVHGISFSVRAGEILGIAGVQGNGQTELAEALTGLRPPSGGTIRVDGHEVTAIPYRVKKEHLWPPWPETQD